MRWILCLLVTSIPAVSLAAATSAWVHPDASGRLAYQSLPSGDRIMDFSSAGYGGGGVTLPSGVPVRKTVRPSGADDTAAIQSALDEVGQLPLVAGFRGAVRLERGEFHGSAPINLGASGVVLIGSGAGAAGTTLTLTGKPHVGFILGSTARAGAKPAGAPVPVADAYVPAGARSLTVRDAGGFAVGDSVLIRHPVTTAWIKFMGMDGLVRNGKAQTWIAAGAELSAERVITAIAKNTLTFDLPLSDCLDSTYLSPTGATVVKCVSAARLSQVGVESLRIVSPPQAITIDAPQHQAVRIGAVEDGWLRDVAIADTVNSVNVGAAARRVTLEQVAITHTVATTGAAKPADFSINGTQVLLHRCSDRGDNVFFLATLSGVVGPNVLLDCEFRGNGWIQPHMRWATGLLIDNCRVPDGGIEFMNRGEYGSGHGWAIGWAVAWNCTAKSFLIQRPPGAMNWAIGCTGPRRNEVMPFNHAVMPEGTIESPGVPVAPRSLYLAQLAERLGAAAVRNVEN